MIYGGGTDVGDREIVTRISALAMTHLEICNDYLSCR